MLCQQQELDQDTAQAESDLVGVDIPPSAYNHDRPAPPCQLTNIATPGTNDCICGRGGLSNKYIGNRRFRHVVEHIFKQRYFAASRTEKPKVAANLVATWRRLDPPGRFLTKMDPSGKTTSAWKDIGDKEARKKASQCLRKKKASTSTASLPSNTSTQMSENSLSSATGTLSSIPANEERGPEVIRGVMDRAETRIDDNDKKPRARTKPPLLPHSNISHAPQRGQRKRKHPLQSMPPLPKPPKLQSQQQPPYQPPPPPSQHQHQPIYHQQPHDMPPLELVMGQPPPLPPLQTQNQDIQSPQFYAHSVISALQMPPAFSSDGFPMHDAPPPSHQYSLSSNYHPMNATGMLGYTGIASTQQQLPSLGVGDEPLQLEASPSRMTRSQQQQLLSYPLSSPPSSHQQEQQLFEPIPLNSNNNRACNSTTAWDEATARLKTDLTVETIPSAASITKSVFDDSSPGSSESGYNGR